MGDREGPSPSPNPGPNLSPNPGPNLSPNPGPNLALTLVLVLGLALPRSPDSRHHVSWHISCILHASDRRLTRTFQGLVYLASPAVLAAHEMCP